MRSATTMLCQPPSHPPQWFPVSDSWSAQMVAVVAEGAKIWTESPLMSRFGRTTFPLQTHSCTPLCEQSTSVERQWPVRWMIQPVMWMVSLRGGCLPLIPSIPTRGVKRAENAGPARLTRQKRRAGLEFQNRQNKKTRLTRPV
ncbi:hypothetical protein PIB30_026481 [Stylosanthes scabra]|uniref:Uncharacterized protein n=1 Tax=Stylosanthes scabra TaxID=79078 RepID=A0ABU6X7X2_9FABA|nr:hypothetical protein [Stylosanthes scabra]